MRRGARTCALAALLILCMKKPTPLDRLHDMRAQAAEPGGAERAAAQRAKGKLLARERLELLLDEGSFE